MRARRRVPPVGGFYYNTNGFAFHRLEDAVTILAELGYDGVAITPDVHHLGPFGTAAHEQAVRETRALLRDHGLGVVIETGARFLLDARRKHRPTLLDEEVDAALRLAFLEQCVGLAADLGAPVVSTWSGSAPEGLDADTALARLAGGLRSLCRSAEAAGVRIGFEPEPGMAVERADEWPQVRDAVGHPALGLTLDVGHCLATREGDPADVVRTHAADLVVLQLDDHRPGVHEHLAFGDGVLDLARVAAAVREIAFEGPLEVELSRHSATAPQTAADTLTHLRREFGDLPPGGRLEPPARV